MEIRTITDLFDHEHHRKETIGTPIRNESGSRYQGNMGTPERPEVKTAFYSQISQAWQGPVKTSALINGTETIQKLTTKVLSSGDMLRGGDSYDTALRALLHRVIPLK